MHMAICLEFISTCVMFFRLSAGEAEPAAATAAPSPPCGGETGVWPAELEEPAGQNWFLYLGPARRSGWALHYWNASGAGQTTVMPH